MEKNKPLFIVLHCSDSVNGDNSVSVDVIRSWHLKRGFTDIGYHWVVYADGTIHEGRPMFKDGEFQMGAHVQGHNKSSIGICMVGRDKFSINQFLALRSKIDELRKEFPAITEKDIVGHYQLDLHGKTCPNFLTENFLKFYSFDDWTGLKQNLLEAIITIKGE